MLEKHIYLPDRKSPTKPGVVLEIQPPHQPLPQLNAPLLDQTQVDLLLKWFHLNQRLGNGDAQDHTLACNKLIEYWPQIANLFSTPPDYQNHIDLMATHEIFLQDTQRIIQPDICCTDHYGRIHIIEVTRQTKNGKRRKHKSNQVKDHAQIVFGAFDNLPSVTGWLAEFQHSHIARHRSPSQEKLKFSFRNIITLS